MGDVSTTLGGIHIGRPQVWGEGGFAKSGRLRTWRGGGVQDKMRTSAFACKLSKKRSKFRQNCSKFNVYILNNNPIHSYMQPTCYSGSSVTVKSLVFVRH